MEQLSEIERAAQKLMLAAKARYDRARSTNVMREEIDGMMQRAPTIPAGSSRPSHPMSPITLGAHTVATTSAGALHVRTGDYLLVVTPDPRTEPRIEIAYSPKELPK